MRLVFLGNDPWSVPSLEALAKDPVSDVVLVITNPPRPAGRGSRLTPTAVAEAGRRLGVPVLETDGVKRGEGFDAISNAASDLLVVVAYGELLSPEVLSLAPLGAVNVHFSLLPRWRGASPVQHAILVGDPRTGVTVMQMDPGLDTGPILATSVEDIRPVDDAGSLGTRLAQVGAALLLRTLPPYGSGALKPEAQPQEGATQAPKLGPRDRLIDWERSAKTISARVRALSPDPGASTRFRGDALKVLEAQPSEVPQGGAPTEPGTVVTVDTQGPVIATGAGSVRLTQVAPSGRKRMSGADWARGARIQPGESLR